METLTYRELKDQLEKLTEEQLDQPAQMWPEERPRIDVHGIEINQEDLYYDMNNPDDGCAPLLEFHDVDIADIVLGIEVGKVMLI
jgi:hypothetical protein